MTDKIDRFLFVLFWERIYYIMFVEVFNRIWKKRKVYNDEGLSLMELLVVVLILIVLSVIAIPIFLNQRASANDSKIKTDVEDISKFLSQTVASGDGSTIVGADGTTVGTITSALGQRDKNGAKVFYDSSSRAFCISKVSPSNKIVVAKESKSVYFASSECISAISSPSSS